MGLRVALVSVDHRMRLELVRALEAAPIDWDISLHRGPPAGADVVVCDPALDIDGALRFDPAAPEELVEAIASFAGRGAGPIFVTGAGGGSGATSIGLHIAAELVTRGRSTTFVDMSCDGDVAQRVGLPDVTDLGSGDRVVPVQGGFRLLITRARDVALVVRGIRATCERVVVDISKDGLCAAPPGTRCVVAIVPSPSGVRRARSLIQIEAGITWVPVVNRLGAGGEMTVPAIGRDLGMPVAVEFPCCASLRDREDDARLLKPGWTRWSRRIARLVDLIES